MAEIKCSKGHSYNPDEYSACPECNKMQKQIFFGGTPVGAPGRTVPLQEVQQNNPNANNTPDGGVPVIGIGKTMPLDMNSGDKKVTEVNKTIGYMQERLGINPVVGWLVCIEGEAKGKDYKLYGYINSIGRSQKMDVCLKDDETISEENHARISYSDKYNRFNITPADGKNLFYVNGEEVLVPTQLQAYDIIEFGKTTLVFVPLCCDRFIWSNEKNQK